MVTLAAVALTAALAGVAEHSSAKPKGAWKLLEPGLELGTFAAKPKSEFGDSRIRILRIDLQRFQLRLLNASAPGQGKAMTMKEWVLENGLVAGINASMYQKDLMTSVSFMRTRSHTNSSWLSKDRTVLAFDPDDDSDPTARIVDRDCEDLSKIHNRYGTLIQSIRMISCKGENVWKPQEKKWSIAAFGLDKQGRFLFIHVRSPYSAHDLINILLKLPLDLNRAMYAEGGVDAQMFVNSRKGMVDLRGNYWTGAGNTADLILSRPVPNVLGIARAKKSKRIARKRGK